MLNQTDAAQYVGVTRSTIARWERAGRLRRVNTPRPGTWYERRALDAFRLKHRTQRRGSHDA